MAPRGFAVSDFTGLLAFAVAAVALTLSTFSARVCVCVCEALVSCPRRRSKFKEIMFSRFSDIVEREKCKRELPSERIVIAAAVESARPPPLRGPGTGSQTKRQSNEIV